MQACKFLSLSELSFCTLGVELYYSVVTHTPLFLVQYYQPERDPLLFHFNINLTFALKHHFHSFPYIDLYYKIFGTCLQIFMYPVDYVVGCMFKYTLITLSYKSLQCFTVLTQFLRSIWLFMHMVLLTTA